MVVKARHAKEPAGAWKEIEATGIFKQRLLKRTTGAPLQRTLHGSSARVMVDFGSASDMALRRGFGDRRSAETIFCSSSIAKDCQGALN
jgi:hypothetical protein